MAKLGYVSCTAIKDLGNGQWTFFRNDVVGDINKPTVIYSNNLSIALDDWEDVDMAPGTVFQMDEITFKTSDVVDEFPVPPFN